MRLLVTDPDGYPMGLVSMSYATRAVERGELEPTEREDTLRVVPRPMCVLDGRARRRQWLKKAAR